MKISLIIFIVAVVSLSSIYALKFQFEKKSETSFLNSLYSKAEKGEERFTLSQALGFDWDEVCILQIADTSSRSATTKEFIRLHEAQYGHWTQRFPWILSPIDWATKKAPAHSLGFYIHEYSKAFVFFKAGTAIKVIKITPPKDNLAIQVGDMACQKDLNVRTDIFNSMPIFRFSK